MRTGRPPHLKTFDYTGFHRYSLTFCTDKRRELFKNHPVVALVLSQISRAANECRFAVIAYCFMPDHLHLLAHGNSDDADCKEFIKVAKQYAGYYYRKEYRMLLWQRYGFERTLRKEEQSAIVANYILENPVRAGLVASPQDYPFLGSLVCSRGELFEWVGSQARSA